jgi:hypothetical protein
MTHHLTYDLKKRYLGRDQNFPVISSEYGLDQFIKWLELYRPPVHGHTEIAVYVSKCQRLKIIYIFGVTYFGS